MQITILAPPVWQPVLQAAAAELPASVAALLPVLVDYLHDRHAGITPRMAGRLARALLQDGGPPPIGTRRGGLIDWSRVIDRLARGALPDAEPQGGRDRRRSPTTVVAPAIPFVMLDRVVLPLLLAAQKRIDRCCLFGGDGHALMPDGESFLADYESALEAAMSDLTMGIGGPPAFFWQHRGIDAAALSRGLGAGAAGRGLSEADPETVALLTRLEPVLGPMQVQRTRAQQLRRSDMQSGGVRPREGGVTGIRMSRSMDDLNDMLVSEYTNEPLMMLDRLVNSGFMVRHRPPFQQNRRDVLLVGAMPLGARDTAARLAKVAWIDMVARLAPLLQGGGLRLSDFIWLDGDRMGGLAHGAASLPQALSLPQSANLTPEERLRFVWALDWLPGLLDRRRAYPPGLEPPVGEGDDAVETLRAGARWAACALARMPAGAGRDNEAGRLDLKDYGFVHVMLMLPRPAAGLDSGEARSAVMMAGQTLRLMTGRRQSASILWVPQRVADLDGWALSFEAGPLRHLADNLPPPGAPVPDGDPAAGGVDMHRLAGGLIGLWLTHLQEAIFGG
ncbi:hypothetical protein GE253_12640 [Niveispirillum sp. SYP-B3756]|uniref:hypothetical protein n=1 Tax=Niveispirillum sp. SYP-B3756 TaxID=2662178 RepID=UPI001291C55F|nr:hypothetical protein [Niveispirillum sp. SYP-B3756]MQP66189.1 hypothetical protein [Niveispirillum sp. SYP-B3756]